MTDFKLKQEELGSGHVQEKFNAFQHAADLSEPSRGRVDDAIQATVAHIVKSENLTQGMRSKDIPTALNFLDTHYGHLNPKERAVIEKSLNSHFHVPDSQSPPEAANDEKYNIKKAA